MSLATERLLAAPVIPALLRLSAPGVVLVAFQTTVSVADTYFVGRLGTAPLAGLALVFPLVMLLQMTSAGAMGGERAGNRGGDPAAGHAASARRIVLHALVIAAAMAAAFTVLVLALGPALYRLLGGSGESLAHALGYSNVLFAGALSVWLANTLSSVLRGTGNMAGPAAALIGAALVHIGLSAWLVPRIGIEGAALAYVAGFALAAAAMACLVFRRGSPLRPQPGDWNLEWPLFREILRVGGLSLVSSLQTVLTAVILTGFVGRHGEAALAGYGVGLRLELLQIPLVFAVGQALVVLVGMRIGAGRPAEAKRVAWIGATLAASISLAIAVAVTAAPRAWIGLFSSDAAVIESGGIYLRIVAPFFPLLAAAIALYFASQGAGHVLGPVLAGTVRLALVLAGGFAVASLQGLFMVIAVAMAALALLTAWLVARADWR